MNDKKLTKEEIIAKLEAGNQRFMSDALENPLRNQPRRDVLTKGQEPDTIVLSCADSRVVPEVAFDAGLGELFVVRVAGNIANTDTIASIEYAVAHVGSQIIMVLGHEKCGAVTAAVAGGDNGYNLNHLLSHITPAIHACGDGASITEVIKKNAHLTAKELTGRSAIIKSAVDSGKVKIIPAYYHLATGEVEILEEVEA